MAMLSQLASTGVRFLRRTDAQGVVIPTARTGLGSTLLWMQAVVLIAIAQVLFAGYRLGVGNQTIQIPFLKKFLDPSLYMNDAAVSTRDSYPSFFFKALAWLVGTHDIPTVYLVLHLVTTAGVMLAAYALARAIFRDHLAGLVTVALLFAGHHRALAGDEMYSMGFTHTWAVFPLAILAMVLLYREWLVAAFALAGIIFNFHALTAAYLWVMFGLWALCDLFAEPRLSMRGIGRLILLGVVFAAFASPTLVEMATIHEKFDALWISLTRVRSADHSFPSSWWQPGTPDVPRFMLLAGLAALSLSFPASARQQRKSLLIAAAAAILFLAGVAFAHLSAQLPLMKSEWLRERLQSLCTLVLRAQLFRASRLLIVLMLVHIAHSIAAGWRMPIQKHSAVAVRWLEAISATATLLAIAVPPLLPYLPYAFALAAIVALVNGRLAWWQAAFSAVVMGVVLVAWRRLSFPLPASPVALALVAIILLCVIALAVVGKLKLGWGLQALLIMLSVILPAALAVTFVMAWMGAAPLNGAIVSPGEIVKQVRESWLAQGALFWLAIGCGVGLWMASRLEFGRVLRALLLAAGLGVCALLPMRAAHDLLLASSTRIDPWMDIQLWAKEHTPKDAVFLTPPEQSGFRIFSERSTICEWRDGTQMYFSARFGTHWWDTVRLLRKGLMYNAQYTQQLSPGRSLRDLPDGQLADLARSLGAGYIVLPRANKSKWWPAYADEQWAVYKTPRKIDMLPGIVDSDLWVEQESFIHDVCEPNIEKYRKGEVRLEIVDASGQPLADAAYTVTQTRQAFGFGASLEFFERVAGRPANGEYQPEGPVDPRELERFKEVFNYSVIPFSGKWASIEPVEGRRTYSELDKYIDWCAKNNIEIEYHFLSGLAPSWLYQKMRRGNDAELRDLFLKHATEVVNRYADRVKTWQVINDKYMLQNAASVFRELHRLHPDLKLGLSDCTKFYNSIGDPDYDVYRGLDDAKQLMAEGAAVSFFSMHGHSPHGLWPNWHQMYDSFDHFAAEGMKVKISEVLVPLASGRRGFFGGSSAPIVGDVVNGEWTPKMQAEFLTRFYTVAFSHPAVNAVNYWNLGPDTATPGANLLDENYRPTPAFNALKQLIREQWMTHLPPGRTAADGSVSFRGFHGDYQVVVTLPSGKTATGTFAITPDGSNRWQLIVDEAHGALQPR